VSDPLQRQRAQRAIAIGAIIFVSSLVLILLPLVIPLGAGAKYLIAIAFVGAIAGLSIILNGIIDYFRRGR
jgi:hypothetical protein